MSKWSRHLAAPVDESISRTRRHPMPENDAAFGPLSAGALSGAIARPTLDNLNPHTIGRVQRLYGNQFARSLIQRALFHEQVSGRPVGAASGLVQRYNQKGANPADSEGIAKWKKNFHRASAGGGIFQVDDKKVMARNDILANSEAQLAAQGSFIQLVGEPATSAYSWVKVVFRGATAGQRRDEDVDRLATEAGKTPAGRRDDLLNNLQTTMAANNLETDPGKIEGARGANKSMSVEQQALLQMIHPGANDIFMTIRDCHRTARTVMGDLGITPKEEHVVISDTDGTVKKLRPDKSKDREIYSTDGHAAAISFLKFAFDKFGAVAGAQAPGHALLPRIKGVKDTWNYKEAMGAYEAIQADPVLGGLFNRTFHVNDQARVAVGQALVQVNDEYQRQSSVNKTYISPRTGKLEDLWNFHWAGVVLMDGADYVTLQAVADQQATTLTVNWWFKMYGTDGQSFHSEEKEDPHVGSRPLTLSISAERPAPRPRVQMPTFV